MQHHISLKQLVWPLLVTGGCIGQIQHDGLTGDAGIEHAVSQDAGDTLLDADAGYGRLMACSVEEPCGEQVGFAQLTEATYRYVAPDTACVLRAMRDRTPGRYLHETSALWGNGSSWLGHVLVITKGGSVLYARDGKTYDSSGTVSVPSGVAQRCQPKSPAYFEGCVSAIDKNHLDAAFGCAYAGDYSIMAPLQWFDSCEAPTASTCG